MKKDIRQYLHLYIGAEVETNIKGQYVHPYGNVTIEVLTPENYNLIMDSLDRKERYEKEGDNDLSHLYCKLKLRTIQSVTDEEVNEIASIILGHDIACYEITRTEERDYMYALWKKEDALPSEQDEYNFITMGMSINDEFGVRHKWDYHSNIGVATTDRPLHCSHQITRYCLSKSFDLFGLINDGLALDSTKQPAQ